MVAGRLSLACTSLVIIVFGAVSAFGQDACSITPEGVVCSVGKPIVGGTTISAAVQQRLGLVTVSGDCSGTLLNDWWVLTADHCVGGGVQGAPAADGIPVRAAWTSTVAIANRYVRLWWARDQRDVALIFLGTNNFGHLANPQGVGSGIAIGDTLVKFGRGISAYAQGARPPRPILRPCEMVNIETRGSIRAESVKRLMTCP